MTDCFACFLSLRRMGDADSLVPVLWTGVPHLTIRSNVWSKRGLGGYIVDGCRFLEEAT